jgi:hypothetical protein
LIIPNDKILPYAKASAAIPLIEFATMAAVLCTPAAAPLTLQKLDQTLLCEDLVEKIAKTVHFLKVDDLHTEMALELTFLKNRTPMEGLKKLFPQVMLYVHTLDKGEDEVMFDSLCVMDRVVIYRLNETELLVLSDFTDSFYHAGYYKINHAEKRVVLMKNKTYARVGGYGPGDEDCEIDFIREALGMEDYSFGRGVGVENKWLLGGAMINWFIGAGEKDLGV